MKNSLKDKVIVIDIAGDFSLVKTENHEMTSKLINLGFHLNENGFFEKINNTQEERVSNIKSLINIDALFSSGKDWSPEELMNYYSELGLIKQQYKIISWKSQNEYVIRTILSD
ncbi:hypothetical protein [Acinetobacter johnsonii]|jgi:predicted HAD superfamily phosphohydrolase YqeG|uniref:hypothetical protein n=1 Tax=Acinetobacter johnsonii TaxID=40214 RepID=UPI002936B940|nr:hypothetical protein [Acinetobacter johnsonii]MDV2489185.1 hypothetical protein [Acinetobacter johnsonii]